MVIPEIANPIHQAKLFRCQMIIKLSWYRCFLGVNLVKMSFLKVFARLFTSENSIPGLK